MFTLRNKRQQLIFLFSFCGLDQLDQTPGVKVKYLSDLWNNLTVMYLFVVLQEGGENGKA